MLHAARQICTSPAPGEPPHPVGTIVVHVLVFDYRTLPFITSQNPYFEVFRPVEGTVPREGTTGSEVEVAIYGWSLGAVYNSPHAAWPISDELFSRIYDPARRPFWTTVRTNDGSYRVYFSNDRVFISVRDEGVGISPEQSEQIFDPFFTTKESGTGLGLAIASMIIEQHGGTLTAENNVTRGMTFRLELPILRARAV